MNFNLNEVKDYVRGMDSRGYTLEYTTLIDVIDIIKEKTPYYYDMIKSGVITDYQQILRGDVHIYKDSSNFKAVKVYDPKEYKRQSAHTENFYTEIMDNSKYWIDYPNRSHSIIGTTDMDKARKYGTVYHVIPMVNNCEIAVCPASDIWGSFQFALDKLDGLFKEDMAIDTATPDFAHLAGLNNFLRTKFGLSKDSDYNDMRKKVILNDKSFKLLDRNSTWHNSRFDYDKEELIKIQNKWGTFLNYIEYLLSPKWNEFEMLKYNKQVALPNNREVWTDCECLFIEHSLHEKMLSALL